MSEEREQQIETDEIALDEAADGGTRAPLRPVYLPPMDIPQARSSRPWVYRIPEFCLVVLVGPSGSGKSTFARRNFRPSEVLSSDEMRGRVSDNPSEQGATDDAFEILHALLDKRLKWRRLTVVDATNLETKSRDALRKLAKQHHCQVIPIVFNFSEDWCQLHNRDRGYRQVPSEVISEHCQLLKRSLKDLQNEGARRLLVLDTPEQMQALRLVRSPLPPDRRRDAGPFDIIGDVHGCFQELLALLEKLGYQTREDQYGLTASHPEGRKAVFLGDLVDRGPDAIGVLRFVRNMVFSGQALCVPGNHDHKFMRWIRGRQVRITHGLEITLAQAKEVSQEELNELARFIEGLPSHCVLDGGRLVVAHAGLPERMQNRVSGPVLNFALYGQTTGEVDAFGLPVRYPWAQDYQGQALVVYGHTPMTEPLWLSGTVCIDTGCVYGGQLTALRYPERVTVSLDALQVYQEPKRPIGTGFGPDLEKRGDAIENPEYVDPL